MLEVNHAAPSTDIRICLRIRKKLKISDGGRLLSQIRQTTMTRVNQILLAVDLKLGKMFLRFIKIDIECIAINEEIQPPEGLASSSQFITEDLQIHQETPPTPQLLFDDQIQVIQLRK